MRSLAWLANEVASTGGLKAGEIVTTGSTIAPQPMAAGSSVTASFAGLGEVSAKFR